MFLIVDFLNVAYRGFFAIRTLSNSKGVPTNAVYGFIQMVRKWINDVKPTHLVIVLEGETPKRRLAIIPDYKAARPATPELLVPQLELLTRLMPAFGWPTALHPEEEADDFGAAIALAAAQAGHEVRIGSNDKDFFQIVSPQIKILRSTPKETILADEAWVRGRWGIEPSQVAEFLALQGDAVDNIPGVPGVGEKTAAELITRFGTIDHLLKSLDQIQKPRLRSALIESTERIKKNLECIRLQPITDTPPLDAFRLHAPKYEPLLQALSELEFKTLLAHYTKESQVSSQPHQVMLF